tara:strand:+ start:3287 stop:3817 length:531 start_codon:yes stop_codon:yes gene_type:complete
MVRFILITVCLCYIGCSETTFKEFHPNGQLKYAYKERGDHGATTSGKMDDNLNTGGGIIPLVGGSQANNYDITQTESANQVTLTIGDNFKREGPMVHSTAMAINWKGGVRLAGVVGKTIGWVVGVNAWKDITNAKTQGEVDKTGSNNDVKINDSNNTLEGLKSDNATSVELEALSE